MSTPMEDDIKRWAGKDRGLAAAPEQTLITYHRFESQKHAVRSLVTGLAFASTSMRTTRHLLISINL